MESSFWGAWEVVFWRQIEVHFRRQTSVSRRICFPSSKESSLNS